MTMNRRHFIGRASLLTAASSALLRTAWAADADVVAETTYGKVRGIDVAGIKTFKGIPYGANTTGKNRFMPPVEPAPWGGVRDALQYGASAPQRNPDAPGRSSELATATAGLPGEAEDCLVLNVWT